MGKRPYRPADHLYWRRPWSSFLFAGDLFEAIPYADQPTHLVTGEDETGESKHYLAEIALAYGLLVTPTCDMTDQRTGEIAHPYRVLIPVLDFEEVCNHLGAPEDKRGLMRSRDSIWPYLYLPPCPGLDEGELLGLLHRPTMVSDDFLQSPPRRIAQLHPEARRHLKTKLAAYWARAEIEPASLPLYERDEPDPHGSSWPPSPYDPENQYFTDLPPADWQPDLPT
jgi:hypothetical protein